MEKGKIPPRLTAEQAAMFIIYVIHRYREEKGREINRLRFSKGTMRKLCLRQNLHESFAYEVISELAEWGWTMFPAADDYAMIETSVIGSWVRLGSKRVAAERERLREGDLTVMSEIMALINLPPLDEIEED